MAGAPISSFQVKNWGQHSDLLAGRNIQLYGKQYNASFDFAGKANLQDLVRFTITFGSSGIVPGRNGRADCQTMLAYVPQTIGSGVMQAAPSINVPCSGICLLSYTSVDYKHSYPVLDDWVRQTFTGQTATCRECGEVTGFGHCICSNCYLKSNWDWTNYL